MISETNIRSIYFKPLNTLDVPPYKKSSLTKRFYRKVFQCLQDLPKNARLQPVEIWRMSKIAQAILQSGSDLGSTPLLIEKTNKLPRNFIVLPNSKEIYVELENYTKAKTGAMKMGSMALRMTQTEVERVWELKSNDRGVTSYIQIQVPPEFRLHKELKIPVSPMPLAHFFLEEMINMKKAIRKITFFELIEYDMTEIRVGGIKTRSSNNRISEKPFSYNGTAYKRSTCTT